MSVPLAELSPYRADEVSALYRRIEELTRERDRALYSERVARAERNPERCPHCRRRIGAKS